MSLSLFLQCFRPILRHVESTGDCKDDILRKQLLVPVAIFVAITQVLYAWSYHSNGSIFGVIQSIAIIVVTSVFLASIFITKRLTKAVAGTWVTLLGCWSIIGDVWTYGLVEYYTAAVIVMDALLLCGCHSWFTHVVLVVTVVVITLSTTEQTFGIGLYEQIPESYSGYERPAGKGTKFAFNLLCQRLFVFCADFMMTRYFARGMTVEASRVERSVLIAQNIASALACFDLNTAQEMVESADGLPLELCNAFTDLLGNLRSYRPYLPQACLPAVVKSEEEEDVGESCSIDSSLSVRTTNNNTLWCCGLTRRKVTLLQGNLRNFLALAENLGLVGTVDFYERYTSSVFETVRANKGLVEHFDGDRVLVSFNSAKTCSGHHLQALHCACDMDALALEAPDVTEVVMSKSVTSGEVMCGPLGFDGLKSYAVLGIAASWAPLLERLAGTLSVRTLTDSTVNGSAADVADLRLLGQACYTKYGMRVRVYELVRMREVTVEEWMYQLQHQNPWAAHNLISELLLNGKVGQAREMAEASNVAQSGDSRHKELMTRLEAAENDGNGFPVRWEISDIGVIEVPLITSIESGCSQLEPPQSSFRHLRNSNFS